MQFRKGLTSMWFKYKSFGDEEFRLVKLNRKVKVDSKKHKLFMSHKSNLKKEKLRGSDGAASVYSTLSS